MKQLQSADHAVTGLFISASPRAAELPDFRRLPHLLSEAKLKMTHTFVEDIGYAAKREFYKAVRQLATCRQAQDRQGVIALLDRFIASSSASDCPACVTGPTPRKRRNS